MSKNPITPNNPYGLSSDYNGRGKAGQKPVYDNPNTPPHRVPGTPYFYRDKPNGGRGRPQSSYQDTVNTEALNRVRTRYNKKGI